MADLMLVELLDKYGDDSECPYYTVATDSPAEIGYLKQRGEQKGFIVRVRRASSFDSAKAFLNQFGGK